MRACQRLVLLACLLGAPCPLPCSAAADAESPDKKVRAAEALFRQGSVAEAEKLLLTITTPTAKSLQLLGQVQVKLKKYEEALKAYGGYVQAETNAGKRAAGEQIVSELKVMMQTRFKITTTPPGATVFIDSKVDGAVGRTPLSQIVSPGLHRVILELEGYEPLKMEVSATEQKERELPFTLMPMGCPLTVTSDPPRLKVMIDGKGAGMAPVSRRLRSGIYRVEAVLTEGQPPVGTQVTCEERDPRPLSVNLSRDLLAPPDGGSAPDGGAPRDGGGPPDAGPAPDARPARAPTAGAP